MYIYTLNYTIHKILIYLYLGETSLHWAAEYGHTDIVKILLDHEAIVSTQDDDGKKEDNTYIQAYTNDSYH